jgi:predicted nucleic acid-binding protein
MVEEKSIIGVISIFVLMELVRVLQKSAFSADKINDVIVKIKGLNVEIVIPSEFHLITAYELLIELGLDILDALHLCVAIDVADIFVTRDTKLARKIADKIEVMTPEEVKR